MVDNPFWASVGVCSGASQNFTTLGHYHPLLANESWMYSAVGKLVNSSTEPHGKGLWVAVTPWGQPPKGVGPNGDVPSANISVQLVATTAAQGGGAIRAEYFLNDVYVGSLAVPSGVPLFGCAASCANGTAFAMRVKLDDEDATHTLSSTWY